jgi:hypothetical protein
VKKSRKVQNVPKKIKWLEALRAEASALPAKDSRGIEFRKWYERTEKTLRDLFGKDNQYFRDIQALQFDVSPKFAQAIKRIERNKRTLSQRGNNVSHLETLGQSLERGRREMAKRGIRPRNNLFENSIAEAKGILLNAIRDLQRENKKTNRT